MNLQSIQEKLVEYQIDGWLFCDHHNRDEIAYAILGLDATKMTTRRWFYWIPKQGEPVKIVHNIEAGRLNLLPGQTIRYSSWRELHSHLCSLLKNINTVAMQYSPENNIPMVSLVDGGTIDLIRSFNVSVVSSADLVQYFLARLDEEGIALHRQAGDKIQRIKDEAFTLVADSLNTKNYKTEREIQQYILRRFAEENLTCGGHEPIVAVNEHASDPHFEVPAEGSSLIQSNDRLLIDLWAKENQPKGIYYDITWCAYAGSNPPDDYAELFQTVVSARQYGKEFVKERFAFRKPVYGYEVDEAVRKVIKTAGYGSYFTHRTGHSIGTEVHSIGVNIDNLETKDERQLIPGICFSLEPGIYKHPIGVRTEISVYIDYDNKVQSVGAEQEGLLLLG